MNPRRSRGYWAFLVLGLLVLPAIAHAWKPYTHNYTGSRILEGVDFANNTVIIDGRSYSVDPRVTEAIQACPGCYNAGIIGPDGFPDLAFGQSVIHPSQTGKWLRQVLSLAWAAQEDAKYSDHDKKKILAFAYGYLTHAAGDFWAHTLVNELAHGIFPGIKEMAENPSDIPIAVRHIIAEAVIGDATPGYDGNPERGIAPGGYGLTSGDISTHSTPGYAYDAPPSEFIYDALIRKEVLANESGIEPVPGNYLKARGPLLGGFFELRDGMDALVGDPAPEPLQDALDAYEDTIVALESLTDVCMTTDPWKLAQCGKKLLALGFQVTIDSAEAFVALISSTAESLALAVLGSYLHAWVQDIDDGFLHWGELGLATTQALFDAQTFRDVQNEQCKSLGPESLPPAPPNARDNCEAQISITRVLLVKSNDFINHHGLSMLGLPDFAGRVREVLDEVKEAVEDTLYSLGLTYNPLLAAEVQLHALFDELITDALSIVFNVDFEAVAEFLEKPSRFMCLTSVRIPLWKLGTRELTLFGENEHARLDDYLGLSGTDHHVADGVLPLECGRLKDSVTVDPNVFPPMHNTIVMGRLLLLGGNELNLVLKKTLGGRTVETYGAGGNVMVDALVTDPDALGHASSDTPYLRMIDGDHAWRQDGWPVYPFTRPENKTGGTGRFPIWESCALRPAFGTLFKDWENPWNGRGPLPGTPLALFPEGTEGSSTWDFPSKDPVNDEQPPVSTLAPLGGYTDNGVRYVSAQHAFVLTATDQPAEKAFPVGALGLQYRLYNDASSPSSWQSAQQGESLKLQGPDGRYFIDHRSSDPCHTFDLTVGSPEATRTQEIILDTTPPVTTCRQPPFGQVFDTDDVSHADFAVQDALAGVGSISATIDGAVDSTGPVPITQGEQLDMFDYLPGVRTVVVTAADKLGNTGTTRCTFVLRVTSASLLSNLDRYHATGQLPDTVYRPLRAKLRAALSAHLSGNHLAEVNIIRAFTHELRAQQGKSVEVRVASVLLAYAEDLIARGG